jgi:hypothetical protein
MNILPSGGAEPYSFEISGTGTQGTVIQQNNPDIDFSVLGQDEEIILNITVMDANGCSITFDQSFAQCSGNCTTNVAGAPICQCVTMDGVGFDEESCSITGFAVGCSDGGSIHMFNSNNEQVGNVPFSNSTSDPQSLALMNEVLNTNGNDTYTIYFECGCGFSHLSAVQIQKLAASGWHPSDILLNGFIIPKYLPSGAKFHVEAASGHAEYTAKVLEKTKDIINNSTVVNLEQNMVTFAQQLRKHIEDAYKANKSIDNYFKNISL